MKMTMIITCGPPPHPSRSRQSLTPHQCPSHPSQLSTPLAPEDFGEHDEVDDEDDDADDAISKYTTLARPRDTKTYSFLLCLSLDTIKLA